MSDNCMGGDTTIERKTISLCMTLALVPGLIMGSFVLASADDSEGNILVRGASIHGANGLFFDAATNAIYVADMIQNAVQVVTLDGKVTTLVMNGDTDGADGSIDQPCEAIVRGREVIISNMDWPFPGIVNTTWDKPYTLSVVSLD